MSRVRQYTHLFAGTRRILATLRVNLDRAASLGVGSLSFLRCEWEGIKERQPSARLFEEYMAWMHNVMSDVVAQTRRRLTFIFEPPGTRTVELWIYDPGAAAAPGKDAGEAFRPDDLGGAWTLGGMGGARRRKGGPMLVAFSLRLDRIDESLLYQDRNGHWWLSAVCKRTNSMPGGG